MISLPHSTPLSGILPPQEVAPVRLENTTLESANTLIERLTVLPGAGEKATPEQVARHRENLHNCLSELDSTGRWMRQQGDDIVRPVAVGMQAIVEHALLQDLEQNKIKNVSVIFTTLNPPTPLCSESGTLSTSQATTSVINSPGCYDTVISRQVSLRNLIDNPGVETWAFYTHEREKHADQEIFNHLCDNVGERFHAVHANGELPESLSGATYFITAQDGQKSVLGIRITQANVHSKHCVLFTEKGGQQELEELRGYMARQEPENQPPLLAEKLA